MQYETADSIAHLSRALNADDSNGMAAKYGAEALGLPVSGFKQGYRAFDLDGNNDDTNFILELMGRQVK